ncbi:DUF1682-domain-containing protein [Aulographum hederae CBS 113979]|uniref:DUF1682-domain-containing protein n=1 Tax=Aulographum hederae CBS 113979 TaxID=1176131 RepID=A0A6G1H6Z5_9PEZI|nr:DUF1682-domain-containing protein [Aulographum hederae CBS 113979]
MADYLKGLFGGAKPSAQAPIPDSDFADFAGAPDPSPVPISAATAGTSAAPSPSSPFSSLFSPGAPSSAVPYTKWYRVWERTSPKDFYLEAFVLPFIIVILFVHVWGTRTNRRKSKAWMTAHLPILREEFAQVGFKPSKRMLSVDEVQGSGLLKANEAAGEEEVTEELLKEKRPDLYLAYATGRQNAAFLDMQITLAKRYNPFMRFGELALGLFFESMPAPQERMEATLYAFDGKENILCRNAQPLSQKSTFDGFVWAVVHKDMMKRLRDDRYDLSLTSTKDHPKLPQWATVMSESAEITEAMLTPEIIKCINEAGEALEALVISDQPMEQPTKLEETVPRKRISMSLLLPPTDSYTVTLPLFQSFIRLPDHLVKTAHFRPESMRRVRATREDEIRKIKKVDEDEKAEERKKEQDRVKKEQRESKMRNLSAEEQKKFLEKERERDRKRGEKRMTRRG